MSKIYRGAPAKGSPHKGSWGDRYIIESTQHSKRVSCSSCVHYQEDRSCEVKPYYVPDNGYNYWISCEYFELSPELENDIDYKEKVYRYKGEYYIPKKYSYQKRKNTFSDNKNEYTAFCKDTTHKELHELAMLCPFFNKYDNHCKKNKSAHSCSIIQNIPDKKCGMQKEVINPDGVTDVKGFLRWYKMFKNKGV